MLRDLKHYIKNGFFDRLAAAKDLYDDYARHMKIVQALVVCGRLDKDDEIYISTKRIFDDSKRIYEEVKGYTESQRLVRVQ